MPRMNNPSWSTCLCASGLDSCLGYRLISFHCSPLGSAWYTYRISLIRHRGYYFFHCFFCVATIQGRRLFLSKPADISNSLIRNVRVSWWWLLDAVSSKCSLSILLSAMEMTRTTRIALALACSLFSEIICTRVHMPHILATATIWRGHLFRSELPLVRLLFEGGYYSRMVIIRERWLFEGGVYSKKYGI